MYLYAVAGIKVGTKDDEVCSSGVLERWKEYPLVSLSDGDIRQKLGCWRLAIDPGDLSPLAIPFSPFRIPNQGIEPF
jgi:hypothetical protein